MYGRWGVRKKERTEKREKVGERRIVEGSKVRFVTQASKE